MLHSKSYAATFELSCTLLSYAAPFRDMLDPTELCCILKDLRCTLKNIMSPSPTPRPATPTASMFLPEKLKFYRENPTKIPVLGKNQQKCNTAHLLTRPSQHHWSFWRIIIFRKNPAIWNIMSPAHPIAASLILLAILMIQYIEKTPRKVQVWGKIRYSVLLLI